MKRSDINRAFDDASKCFARHGWVLPPNPRWDITDFGLGTFDASGLVLINLAEEPEYCEKLMYARHMQVTPMHTHKAKKEDIICRQGRLAIELWTARPDEAEAGATGSVRRNGEASTFMNGEPLILQAGERVTLEPGTWHAFWADSEECVIGEVSTANDDANDNFFVDPNIGRFPEIDEDEPARIRLISER
ncbi:MAG: D-lyxose/D-mannose family sugar isomerase [Opitutales bacterium]|nr:D-lyxose/D-mannose family sugar isomerase [Opitutales bacterium]